MAADALSRAFAALADPTRRDIVARLTVADATVNELAQPYEVTLQAVSKHLKVLQDAGLVSRSREAQRRPVHLEAGGGSSSPGSRTWGERARSGRGCRCTMGRAGGCRMGWRMHP